MESGTTFRAVLLPYFKMALKMDSHLSVITNLNAHKLTDADFTLFDTKKCWHKFVLKNAGLHDKEDVLQAVLHSVDPYYLVPVKYTVVERDAFFIARNCGPAIRKFCSNSLSPIIIGNNPDEQIILTIETNYMPVEEFEVNMQYHIKTAIRRRLFNSPKGCIDLSDFHREPDLYEIFYCPLFIPRFLIYILTILKRLVVVEGIILSNNNLENLFPLDFLKEFSSLLKLDVSHNKIKDLKFVEEIGKILNNLQEMNLNGNPICSHFVNDIEYARYMKKCIPSLFILDGVTLYNGIPNHQVWLCCKRASGVVNEFLKHYFTLYDIERQALIRMYDKNAILSITCTPRFSPNCPQLKIYQTYSRLLFDMSDKNRILGSYYSESTRIAKVLKNLPSTKHDPYSFKVDVLLFQESCIILVVSGVFKDLQNEPMYISFNRTFVLKKVARNEYKITNDLYHVAEATEDQVVDSFFHSTVTENKKRLFLKRKEEEKLVGLVENFSTMNSDYSKKCLQDCDWNVIKALEVFLENYENFNIPSEAFTN